MCFFNEAEEAASADEAAAEPPALLCAAEAVAAALKGGEAIPTAIGKLTYGETGDLSSKSFELYKWEAGKAVPVE